MLSQMVVFGGGWVGVPDSFQAAFPRTSTFRHNQNVARGSIPPRLENTWAEHQPGTRPLPCFGDNQAGEKGELGWEPIYSAGGLQDFWG